MIKKKFIKWMVSMFGESNIDYKLTTYSSDVYDDFVVDYRTKVLELLIFQEIDNYSNLVYNKQIYSILVYWRD